MKALIVSDSHGLEGELERLKQKYEEQVDIMIHCGDSELSPEQAEITGYEVVNGNCDFGGFYPNEIVQDVEGVRFFVTHGHLYNVKFTMQNILYRAKECQAKIACFGHSHIMGAESVDGVLLINPGSILLPRSRREKTYAMLEVEGNEAVVTFYELDGDIVEQHTFQLS